MYNLNFWTSSSSPVYRDVLNELLELVLSSATLKSFKWTSQVNPFKNLQMTFQFRASNGMLEINFLLSPSHQKRWSECLELAIPMRRFKLPSWSSISNRDVWNEILELGSPTERFKWATWCSPIFRKISNYLI